MWNYIFFFCQINGAIILPGDTLWSASEWPDVGMRFIEASYFSLFTFWYGFWNYKFLFVNIWCRFQCEKLPDFNVFFLLYCEWRTVELFPPAKSWLVNSNFKRVGCMNTRRKRKSYLKRNKNSWYLINTYITNH